MNCNLDKDLNRWNTDSVKYDAPWILKSGKTIPMWVADMDFQSPKPILDTI